MDWNSCLRNRESKQIAPDREMAMALRKTSAHKEFSAKKLPLQEETIAAKISLSYDAVRELLEARALEQGFKIYNHICYTAFLREILDFAELAEEFDTLRIVRNDINYYGKDLTVGEAEAVLRRLATLLKDLRNAEVQK